jgi:hypothetical protein
MNNTTHQHEERRGAGENLSITPSSNVLELTEAQEPVAKSEAGCAGHMESPVCLEQILARALVDPEFRDVLFRDRAKALQEYSLSASDREALDLLNEQLFDYRGEVASIVGATCSAYIPPDLSAPLTNNTNSSDLQE